MKNLYWLYLQKRAKKIGILSALVLGLLFLTMIFGSSSSPTTALAKVGGKFGGALRSVSDFVGELPYKFYSLRNTDLPVYNLVIDEQRLTEMNEYYASERANYEREKEYKKAEFIADGQNFDVKVTYRGDEDIHFYYPKKSWRIDFSNDNLYQGMESLNLIIPEDRGYLIEHFNNYRAKKLGLAVPPSRFVVLKVNGDYQGVYLQIEHWGKELIEKQRLSGDTNLYGEDAFGGDIWHDTSLWQKYMDNPNIGKNDISDLNALLTLLDHPDDDYFYQHIGSILDLKNFYQWQAHSVLSGSTHQDNVHNIRLYFAPSVGKFRLIPWDVYFGDVSEQGVGDFGMDDIRYNFLVERILRNPEFLQERNRVLWEYVSWPENLEADLAFYDETYAQVKSEFFADKLKRFTSRTFKHEVVRLRALVSNNFNTLRSMLENTQVSTRLYHHSQGLPADMFALEIEQKSLSPVVLQSLTFDGTKGELSTNGQVFLDNGDNIYTSADALIGELVYQNTNKTWDFVATDKAVEFLSDVGLHLGSGKYQVIPRSQRIFVSLPGSGQMLSELETEVQIVWKNNLSLQTTPAQSVGLIDERVFLHLAEVTATVDEFLVRHPEFFKKRENMVGLRGDVQLNQTVVIPRSVSLYVEPGTVVRLGAGVSMVSYGGVEVAGTPTQKVQFLPLTSLPWGTFAVIGAPMETRINYAVFQHQPNQPPPANPEFHELSTDLINGMAFRGMVNIFSGDALVENSDFRFSAGDDGLNLKYGKVVVRNNTFVGHSADALDTDFVTGEIVGNSFVNNGNDGVDITGSTMLIRENFMKNSADKGISVGEESKAVVVDNTIVGGEEGVAVKDSSFARIVNSVIAGNAKGISLYRKKTIFSGGMAEVFNTLIINNTQAFVPDALSAITVDSSVVSGGYSAGTNILDLTPDFVDDTNDNYQLRDSAVNSQLQNGGRLDVLKTIFPESDIGTAPIGLLLSL